MGKEGLKEKESEFIFRNKLPSQHPCLLCSEYVTGSGELSEVCITMPKL